MFANKVHCCGQHRVPVKRAKNPPDKTRFQSWANGGFLQNIDVSTSQCAGAGVKVIGDWFRPLHRNILRQKGIRSPDP